MMSAKDKKLDVFSYF